MGKVTSRAEVCLRVEEHWFEGGEEAVAIGQTVDHEPGEGGFGVEQKVLVVADGEGEIDARGAEPLCDALAVGRSSDD